MVTRLTVACLVTDMEENQFVLFACTFNCLIVEELPCDQVFSMLLDVRAVAGGCTVLQRRERLW